MFFRKCIAVPAHWSGGNYSSLASDNQWYGRSGSVPVPGYSTSGGLRRHSSFIQCTWRRQLTGGPFYARNGFGRRQLMGVYSLVCACRRHTSTGYQIPSHIRSINTAESQVTPISRGREPYCDVSDLIDAYNTSIPSLFISHTHKIYCTMQLPPGTS